MAENENLVELSKAGVAVWLATCPETVSAAATCSRSSMTTPSSA